MVAVEEVRRMERLLKAGLCLVALCLVGYNVAPTAVVPDAVSDSAVAYFAAPKVHHIDSNRSAISRTSLIPLDLVIITHIRLIRCLRALPTCRQPSRRRAVIQIVTATRNDDGITRKTSPPAGM